RGDEVDVANVVAAESGVHQPRDQRVLARVVVEVPPLHQRRRTVSDADDRDVDLALLTLALLHAPRARPRLRWLLSVLRHRSTLRHRLAPSFAVEQRVLRYAHRFADGVDETPPRLLRPCLDLRQIPL